MRRRRLNHSPACKAIVALPANQGDKTLVELAEQFDLHPNPIREWRERLLEKADSIFGRGQQQQEEAVGHVRDLHAKIGQLTMERDFLEQGLERIHGPGGKK